MRNWFQPPLRIGLSTTGISLVQPNGWLRPGASVLADAKFQHETDEAIESIANQLGKLIIEAKCGGVSCVITVADDLARYFIVTPPANTTQLQDCQAAAGMRFQALYGDSAANWQLEADWSATQPFLACAMKKTFVHALTQCAREHHIKIVSVVPHFVAAWNRWCGDLQSNAWFGVLHGTTMTLAAVRGKQLTSIQTIPLPSNAFHVADWLVTYVEREALRLNLSVPSHVQLCGDVPQSWTLVRPGSVTCVRMDTSPLTFSGNAVSSEALLAMCGALQ